jgi:hypothetical protein
MTDAIDNIQFYFTTKNVKELYYIFFAIKSFTHKIKINISTRDIKIIYLNSTKTELLDVSIDINKLDKFKSNVDNFIFDLDLEPNTFCKAYEILDVINRDYEYVKIFANSDYIHYEFKFKDKILSLCDPIRISKKEDININYITNNYFIIKSETFFDNLRILRSTTSRWYNDIKYIDNDKYDVNKLLSIDLTNDSVKFKMHIIFYELKKSDIEDIIINNPGILTKNNLMFEIDKILKLGNLDEICENITLCLDNNILLLKLNGAITTTILALCSIKF